MKATATNAFCRLLMDEVFEKQSVLKGECHHAITWSFTDSFVGWSNMRAVVRNGSTMHINHGRAQSFE